MWNWKTPFCFQKEGVRWAALSFSIWSVKEMLKCICSLTKERKLNTIRSFNYSYSSELTVIEAWLPGEKNYYCQCFLMQSLKSLAMIRINLFFSSFSLMITGRSETSLSSGWPGREQKPCTSHPHLWRWVRRCRWRWTGRGGLTTCSNTQVQDSDQYHCIPEGWDFRLIPPAVWNINRNMISQWKTSHHPTASVREHCLL